ncbi:SDR family oxidoreductase, partial [Microvirga massiliensis]|uniref:SDR family oxidoreductase n=1 Tax=Microvirga massiliensis TaxID=1033741 RepID=UPI00062B69E1
MRVLLTGASGLIGSAVLTHLGAEGHEVIAVTRTRESAARPHRAIRWVMMDVARATRPEDWLPHLTGIDAVVNCAGVLQDSPYDSTIRVHARGAAALFTACERAGVRRVVHLSAIGVDREAPTAFSRSKFEGDKALMACDLDWVILRPSVVVGRPAYGGSALFRGLAALSILPVMPDTGPLQIVQLDDLTRTVLCFLRPEAPARKALEIVGPERLAFSEVVQIYRGWLGWPRARQVAMPRWAAQCLYRLGDLLGLLGWRPPMRSTAGREIVRGATGDPSEWVRLTGIEPQPLAAALAAEPASVQDRWFARLYFLKPVVFGVLAVFWIVTGLVSLGPGYDAGVHLMEGAGAGRLAGVGVIAGTLVDIAVGIGIALRRAARLALWAALAVSVFYAIAATALAPALWADPLGPLVKIGPILVL